MPKIIDLTGQKFNRLTVLERAENRKKPSGRNVIQWKCQCDCGNFTIVSSDHLKGNHTQSCGCLRREKVTESCLKDLTGQRFGKWTVIKRGPNQKNATMWECKCDCGTISNVCSTNLLQKKTLSCGCNGKSIGELNIIKILQENNINFTTQYNNFNDLDKHLKYDFYLPDYNRLIEFDGEQHYQTRPHGFFTEESLQGIAKRDKIKNKYAITHNIALVRVPYWERDTITLDILLNDKYLISPDDIEED